MSRFQAAPATRGSDRIPITSWGLQFFINHNGDKAQGMGPGAVRKKGKGLLQPGKRKMPTEVRGDVLTKGKK